MVIINKIAIGEWKRLWRTTQKGNFPQNSIDH